MKTPALINIDWYYKDETATDDTRLWTISNDRVKVIQDAFVEYMEQGLDFQLSLPFKMQNQD